MLMSETLAAEREVGCAGYRQVAGPSGKKRNRTEGKKKSVPKEKDIWPKGFSEIQKGF